MNQLLFHITQEMMTNLSGQQRPLVEEDYIRLRQSLTDIEGILQRVMVPPSTNVVVAPVVAPVIAPVVVPFSPLQPPRRNIQERMVTPPPRNQHPLPPERPQRVQPVRQAQIQTYEQAAAPFYERLHNQRRPPRKVVVKSKVLKKRELDVTMEDVCGICMDSHKKRDTIETSCCKHSFGAECFKTYQRTTRNCPCPICRNDTFEIMEFRARKPSRVTTPATPATANAIPAENATAPPAEIAVPTNVPIVDVPIVNLVDVV